MRLFSLAIVLVAAIAIQLGIAGDIQKPDLQPANTYSSLDSLAELTHSGQPTLAYFYYSVACSCQAAQCGVAAAVIDSIPEIKKADGDLHYIAIDAYYEDAAESLYNIESVPAIIGFDSDGNETGRLEWFIDTNMLDKLIVRTKLLSNK